MRLEIIVLAALAALASAAPQWPYRDSVAPYYYGYPGKTPYMYRSNDEDDEMDETYMARQDLKLGPSDGSSTVTVIEDDEKDGVRVVETGSAKPVAQSSNNQVQQDQQPAAQTSSSPAQAQQPLNNANNAQQQTATSNGQPLTVQQSGQQPPQAFPPARPNQQNRPQQRPAEEEDEEDEEDESEEDDEDQENEESEEDEEDEEDDEDRKRNDVAQSNSGSEEPAVPQQIENQRPVQQIAPVANVESSDEIVQEEPVPERQPINQQAVVINKVIKNKQSGAAAAAVATPEKPKKKLVSSKTKSPGAIEALVPGYVTDQGEVLVPVDTVTGSQPITIVPDPFSPPSRIIAGPRPIPQSAVPSTPSRQVPYWYRSSPAVNPLTQDIPPSPLARQTLYTPVPPPGSIFTFDDDDDDEDTPAVIPGHRLRQDDDEDDTSKDEDEEADQKAQPKPVKVPLAAVPAVGNSGEDDEAEALAFVSKPLAGSKRPQATSALPSSTGSAASGNKKPAAGATGTSTSNESESEEEESAEEEEDEEEEDEEEDDTEARRIISVPNNKGRMYVDEEFVSFPPSRSPTLFAVIQSSSSGRFPGGLPSRPQQQSQIFSTPNPNNPFQRYVVRVTPSNRIPRPPVSSPLYYRPLSSPIGGNGPSPNKRVQIASFDVSVEDTRPSGISSGPSSIIVDSDEEGDSSGSFGRPTPVTSYPFVYKVQGSVSGLRLPSGGGPRPGPYGYYGPSGPSGPSGPGIRPPRPSYGPYGPPPYSILNALYGGSNGFGGPSRRPSRPPPSFSYGPPPPRPSGISGGPPVIIRKKPSGGSNRPPKPHLIAVYNPTGPSGPREPVEEEYYTFEVPETENKLVPGQTAPPSKNKRPTVHRKPTPVIKQKQVSEDEEASDESSAVAPPPPRPPVMPIRIIPQGTVRRRIRGGKQLKPKKNVKKTTTSSSSKKQPNPLDQQQHDPLGILSKINKPKSKLH